MFLRHLVLRPPTDIQVKYYGDRLRGTPPLGELNTRGVAEYSDFGSIERYNISETVQDRMTLYNVNSPNGSVISPNSVALGQIT